MHASCGEALEARGLLEDAGLAYVAAGQLDRAIAGEAAWARGMDAASAAATAV